MRNVLNRKKNHISDFSDFHFSSYGHFCTKNCQFSINFHDNSKNKNRKIYFSIDSAHCASFMKIRPFLKGVSIFLIGKYPQGHPAYIDRTEFQNRSKFPEMRLVNIWVQTFETFMSQLPALSYIILRPC